MRRGARSKPFRLERARKIAGVPVTLRAADDIRRAVNDIIRMNHSSDEERDSRLEICSTCEHSRGPRCNLCGCFISYKAKLKNSECPIGKWSSLFPETSVDGPSEQEADE